MWRSTHEAEMASVLRRCRAWEDTVARARVEQDEALDVASVLETELRYAEPVLRRQMEALAARNAKLAERCLRLAVALERVEQDLALATAGDVDATTWGWEPPKEEAS